jgi:hypothetical protein
MQIEVKTRGRVTRSGEPEIVVQMALVPRGGANRAKARQLADRIKKLPELKDYLKRVVVGTSSVSVHLRASFDLAAVLANLGKKDVPGQVPLFGGELPAV